MRFCVGFQRDQINFDDQHYSKCDTFCHAKVINVE